jgi:hypothetical protein
LPVINVGIDLGSTGLRAAYSAYGEAASIITLDGPEWPWLLCEPTADGVLPVSFPSLKSRLGSAARVESAATVGTPADVVAGALTMVRDIIFREPGTSIGHTVISVPANFFTAARTALLSAAEDAGLTDVSLITDSVATVIQQTADVQTGTYLVYGTGYDGCEFGLVRAVRGTYRVLGYESASAPDGASLDALTLRSWVIALRQYGIVPNEIYRGSVDWPRLRVLAEQVKLRLAAGEPMLFPVAVPTSVGRLHVQFDPSSFNRHLRAMVTDTLDRITTLLTRTELDPAAVDLVMLTGGSTGMPVLREAVGGLGRPVTVTEDDHIARGALRHAHQRGRHPTPAYDEPMPVTESRKTGRAPHVSALTTTVLTPTESLAVPEPGQKSTLDNARRLIEAGQLDAARGQLREVITEAQRMLDELETTSREPAGAATATELMASARSRLEAGDHENAIGIAHLAWQKAPHDVDLFDDMLDLHCRAGMCNPTIASFEADERWLICALRHDPTNTHIRGLLAERSYLQAKDLLRAGRRADARQAVEATLKWAPGHPEATSALRELGQRRVP